MTKIKISIERTFPLEQYGNMKPRWEAECDLKDAPKVENYILGRIGQMKNDIAHDQAAYFFNPHIK